MKKTFIICLLMLISCTIYAQNSGITKPKAFSVAKEVKPPILQIIGEPQFIDPSGNNAIDANEQCKIVMTVKNTGFGDGIGITARSEVSGTTNGITLSTKSVPTIKVGSTATIEFPIQANMNTVDGQVNISVYLDEPNGFGTSKQTLSINTRQFVAPLVQIVDYTVTGESQGNLQKTQPFDLQLLLQNTQHGLAENVKVQISIPDNIFLLNGDIINSFSTLQSGEQKSLVYKLIANNNYSGSTIPIKVIISEKYGKYAQNKDISLTMNQALAAKKIEVKPQIETYSDIQVASLRSDVDKDIPHSDVTNSKRFAIIIGNEDYHTHQTGLSAESDVPFAVNDASSFRDYCVSALGVQESHIGFLTNASSAQMKQEISRLSKMAALEGAQAEIIFYYAGHGFPDESTKEPYIIPVDVSGTDLSSAIKLYDLYKQLADTKAGKVTVFIDACFSGGGRDAGLLAGRLLSIEPKKDALTGNMVVMSATQSNQIALPYTDKQHGLFTYYLLKELQSTQGKCSYSELFNYIEHEVQSTGLSVNRKEQKPDISTSNNVSGTWQNWKF